MRWAWLLLALLFVAGCGSETTMPAREIVVRTDESASRDSPDQQSRGGLRLATSRLVFVTHGQASDQFWTVVRRGLQAAPPPIIPAPPLAPRGRRRKPDEERMKKPGP